jgi:hypothetical protein
MSNMMQNVLAKVNTLGFESKRATDDVNWMALGMREMLITIAGSALSVPFPIHVLIVDL